MCVALTYSVAKTITIRVKICRMVTTLVGKLELEFLVFVGEVISLLFKNHLNHVFVKFCETYCLQALFGFHRNDALMQN